MNEPGPDGPYLHDTNTGALYTKREWCDGDSLSMSIVSCLREATGKTIEELEPLQRKVDVDAVESMFEGGRGVAGMISFEHEGHVVSISSDGTVTVRERPTPVQ